MTAALHCTQCGERQTADARFCARCGTANVVGSGDALIGKVIADRYLLVDKIGQGSSGTIYRAEHTTLHRKIAVKILHHALSRDEASVERFRREATTIGQIDNDHLLSVIDFGRTPDERLFFAMELLEGETLDVALQRDHRLDPARAVNILLQVSDALVEAHGHGYIHRDLRPRNVFLSVRRGQKDFVKLLDFGLAKLIQPEVETRQTALGMSFGDPHYMSPEQARGDTIDARSDVFSLGAVGYELLVGVPPFEGSGPFDVLQKVLDTPTPRVAARRPEVPAWLDALVARCLQKRPGDRFESMARVTECLRSETAPPVPAATLVGMQAPSELLPEATLPNASIRPASAPRPAGAAALAAAMAPMHTTPPIPTAAASPTATPVKPAVAPAPTRTLIMPTALAASVAAAAQAAAAAPTAVPPPDPPLEPTPRFVGHDSEQTNPGHRPAVREAFTSTEPAEMVSGEMHSPTQVTPIVMEPAGSSIVVADEMRGEPTGPQRSAGDDGWFSEKAVPSLGADEFEDEAPLRARNPLVIGAIVGGVSLVLFLGVLLWPTPRTTKPKDASKDTEVATLAQPVPPPRQAPSPPVAPAPPEATPTAPAPAVPSAATAPAPTAAAPEPSKPEPSKPKPSKPEPSNPEPSKPEPSKPAIVASTSRPKAVGSAVPKGFKDPFAASATPSGGEVDAMVKTGRQKLAAGELPQAQSAFSKARELDTHNADAYAGLGEVAFEQGDYASAATHLKQALRMSPNRARFLILLGQSYYKQGRAKDAVVEYRRALKVDPTNQEAQRSLELAEKKLASGG